MTAPTELLDRLLRLVILLGEDMTDALNRIDLTGPRAKLVWMLSEGPLTQSELATRTEVSPRNITGLVDAMARTGFVTREPHPTDRRAVHVTLTPHGRATVDVLAAQHIELAGQLFGDLPERTLQGFDDGLGHVLGVVEGLLADVTSAPRTGTT